MKDHKSRRLPRDCGLPCELRLKPIGALSPSSEKAPAVQTVCAECTALTGRRLPRAGRESASGHDAVKARGLARTVGTVRTRGRD